MKKKMINISPTFLNELRDAYQGFPEGFSTILSIPYISKLDKNVRLIYKDKAYLPATVFPVELYEYRRDSKINLDIRNSTKSKFAEKNLSGNIYKDAAMKLKFTRLIDICRQNMNNELEEELRNEIKLFEAMDENDDKGKSLEYQYDLYETVKSFNDYLCIIFLNLTNILTYPNESFYEKYANKEIRISPQEATIMANKICKRMQEEFEDIVLENYPIRETVSRVQQMEKEEPEFIEIKTEKKKTKKAK